VIADVERRILQVFTEGFVDVEREFTQVFRRCSPRRGQAGAHRSRRMLTTGIEVEARPPGKKISGCRCCPAVRSR